MRSITCPGKSLDPEKLIAPVAADDIIARDADCLVGLSPPPAPASFTFAGVGTISPDETDGLTGVPGWACCNALETPA
jgi:hypothetical protein